MIFAKYGQRSHDLHQIYMEIWTWMFVILTVEGGDLNGGGRGLIWSNRLVCGGKDPNQALKLYTRSWTLLLLDQVGFGLDRLRLDDLIWLSESWTTLIEGRGFKTWMFPLEIPEATNLLSYKDQES